MNLFHKKLLLLTVLSSASFLHGMQQPQCPSTLVTQKVVKLLDPKTTIIAFDIDEVILMGREAGYKKWLEGHAQFAQAIGEVKKTYKLMDAHAIINKVVE